MTQSRFNVAEFDAVSTDFDLAVSASEEFQHSLAIDPYLVAGAVGRAEPREDRAHFVREDLSGGLGVAAVA
ncbi:hypothetical protein AB0I10_37195, partial [Streptomyces sp. NPDC050636]|uniref:hypothetical protein n=1 Tax=Streptomyces sp. NPDC050636 TaxID=3154510 RepID=UPI003427D318